VVVPEQLHQVLLVDQLDEHRVARTAAVQPDVQPARAVLLPSPAVLAAVQPL